MLLIGLIVYAIGCLVCCVVMNRSWFKQFKEYNVYWAAFGSLAWPVLAIGWAFGTLGKVIARRLEDV